MSSNAYNEYRDDILMTRASIPNTMGLSSLYKANLGEASGNGVDLSLDYRVAVERFLDVPCAANFTYCYQ